MSDRASIDDANLLDFDEPPVTRDRADTFGFTGLDEDDEALRAFDDPDSANEEKLESDGELLYDAADLAHEALFSAKAAAAHRSSTMVHNNSSGSGSHSNPIRLLPASQLQTILASKHDDADAGYDSEEEKIDASKPTKSSPAAEADSANAKNDKPAELKQTQAIQLTSTANTTAAAAVAAPGVTVVASSAPLLPLSDSLASPPAEVKLDIAQDNSDGPSLSPGEIDLDAEEPDTPPLLSRIASKILGGDEPTHQHEYANSSQLPDSLMLSRQSTTESHSSRPTPLLESDPFRVMATALIAMGFPGELIEMALHDTRLNSLEAAVERIVALENQSANPIAMPPPVPERPRGEFGELWNQFSGHSPEPDRMMNFQRILSDRVQTIETNNSSSEWACKRCSFINPTQAIRCEICLSNSTDSIDSPPTQLASADPSASLTAGPTCGICYDSFASLNMFHVADCGHRICIACWRAFLTGKITDGLVANLKCPELCSRIIGRDEIINSVSEEIGLKYDKFLANWEMAKDPAVRWCPMPDCGTVMRGSKSSPHLICSTCKAETCWNCNNRWHGERSCESVADEVMSDYIKENAVRKCKKCNAPTIKDAGCNHMKCRCGYEYCYLCGGSYSRYHFHPLNLFGCPGLQSNSLSWIGNDSCFGVNCSCGCGVCGSVKRVGYKIGLIFLYILLIALAIPVILIGGPIVLVLECKRKSRRRRPRPNRQNHS